MLVDDVRGEVHALTKTESSLGEENKALWIVEVVAFGRAVERLPVKELFPTDEINGDILVQMTQVDIRLELLIPEGDLNLPTQLLVGEPGVSHRSVIWHD